jgi:hypothetical protein
LAVLIVVASELITAHCHDPALEILATKAGAPPEARVSDVDPIVSVVPVLNVPVKTALPSRLAAMPNELVPVAPAVIPFTHCHTPPLEILATRGLAETNVTAIDPKVNVVLVIFTHTTAPPSLVAAKTILSVEIPLFVVFVLTVAHDHAPALVSLPKTRFVAPPVKPVKPVLPTVIAAELKPTAKMKPPSEVAVSAVGIPDTKPAAKPAAHDHAPALLTFAIKGEVAAVAVTVVVPNVAVALVFENVPEITAPSSPDAAIDTPEVLSPLMVPVLVAAHDQLPVLEIFAARTYALLDAETVTAEVPKVRVPLLGPE